ncbi:membrane-spanning 4-domains subfamily A member 15-like [Parambassis ranga]|uniref:Membrane-spanning 4-domains subfamily A member 15-like n=1 Tax=Parambassis ranga TaxID=210632 RepID=A0A6P7I6S1_9TELE|nr:membrane-spanning 4-domains subfamily A member 15-like [Parambassis ranga]
MSAELYSVNEPSNGALQGTTVGGSKPLHRFIKGQPRIIGTIVLVLGTSFFIVSIAITSQDSSSMWFVIPPGFLQGTLFIISGILFILTEHNLTKKNVTISLALSIVSILSTCWSLLHMLPDLGHIHYRDYDFPDENVTDSDITWSNHYETMAMTVEAVFVLHSFVGAIIFIAMSGLAGTALHSTKSQAIVVMSTSPTATPAE